MDDVAIAAPSSCPFVKFTAPSVGISVRLDPFQNWVYNYCFVNLYFRKPFSFVIFGFEVRGILLVINLRTRLTLPGNSWLDT